MGSQLALKSRIHSTESLAKIFNAQEMIASSHIAKARDVALNAKPYSDAIFTEFINMVVQKVRVLRMLPVEIVESETKVPAPDEEAPAVADVAPLYTFEPSIEEVLDAILPKYIQSRIHECLLTAAASETASRQNAMHTATDNAHNLIDDLTRKLNASRQASITQELTEIIGSADALNKEEE